MDLLIFVACFPRTTLQTGDLHSAEFLPFGSQPWLISRATGEAWGSLETDLIGLCKSGHGDTVTTNTIATCRCSSVVLPLGSHGSLARLARVKGNLCVHPASSHKSQQEACAECPCLAPKASPLEEDSQERGRSTRGRQCQMILMLFLFATSHQPRLRGLKVRVLLLRANVLKGSFRKVQDMDSQVVSSSRQCFSTSLRL